MLKHLVHCVHILGSPALLYIVCIINKLYTEFDLRFSKFKAVFFLNIPLLLVIEILKKMFCLHTWLKIMNQGQFLFVWHLLNYFIFSFYFVGISLLKILQNISDIPTIVPANTVACQKLFILTRLII